MKIICYACVKSDGELKHINPFADMNGQELKLFKHELALTSANAAGYKIKGEKQQKQ